MQKTKVLQFPREISHRRVIVFSPHLDRLADVITPRVRPVVEGAYLTAKQAHSCLVVAEVPLVIETFVAMNRYGEEIAESGDFDECCTQAMTQLYKPVIDGQDNERGFFVRGFTHEGDEYGCHFISHEAPHVGRSYDLRVGMKTVGKHIQVTISFDKDPHDHERAEFVSDMMPFWRYDIKRLVVQPDSVTFDCSIVTAMHAKLLFDNTTVMLSASDEQTPRTVR